MGEYNRNSAFLFGNIKYKTLLGGFKTYVTSGYRQLNRRESQLSRGRPGSVRLRPGSEV